MGRDYRAIHDPDKLAAYAKLAGPAIQAAGGRILVRGNPSNTFEGGLNLRCVVIEFDSVAAANAAHDSAAYKAALNSAAAAVRNSEGKEGRVKFTTRTDYYPFRMKESLPVVKRAVEAVSGIGATPTIRAANGGLDANWMVRHGVPTVTFGAGQNEPHTIDEWINLDEYDRACALAVQLATMR